MPENPLTKAHRITVCTGNLSPSIHKFGNESVPSGRGSLLRRHEQELFSDLLDRGVMDSCSESRSGLQELIKKYRTIFRIPENVNYYSDEDYRLAERKFLKYLLEKRSPRAERNR